MTVVCEGTETVTVPLLPVATKYTAIDAKGSVARAQRWTLAYETTCNAYNLPLGTVYVPCALDGYSSDCVGMSDAWLLETEHVLARDNGGTTRPGNVILACRACNLAKSGTPADPAYVDFVQAAGSGMVVRKGQAALKLFHARNRATWSI